MTSAHKPVFLVVSNNPDLSDLVRTILVSDNTTVEVVSPDDLVNLNLPQIHYIIFLVQRTQSDQTPTSSLIALYDLAKKYQSKIAVIDFHNTNIQTGSIDTTFQLLNQISGNQPLFRYIVTKDVFQDRDTRNTFLLEQKIRQATIDKKIAVSSKGENLLHPLSIEDLIAASLKSLFLERLAGKKLIIIGDSLKDLDFAYLIKDELEKNGKHLNIDTVKENLTLGQSILNTSAESRALLKWLPQDSNEQKLKKKIYSITNEDTTFSHSTTHIVNNKYKSKETQSINFQTPKNNKYSEVSLDKKTKAIPIQVEKPKPKKIFNLHKSEKFFLISIPAIFIAISISSLLVISLIYVILVSSSLNKTKNSLDLLNQGESIKLSQEIKTASKYLQAGEDISHYIIPVYQVVWPKLSMNLNNFSSLLKHSQTTIQSLNESYELANSLYHDLFTPSGESTATDISVALQSRLRTIHQELSQVNIISQNHTFPTFFNEKLSKVNFSEKIDILINQTSQSLKLLESFSNLLSNPKPQFVAILVQDSNELKSSGGTIRSVILANVENQKIVNIRHVSSGEIDQKMTGQILATPEIESITGQDSLTFTNSNTSPNFIRTSQVVSKFLKNSLNFSPDLVIGITTQTLNGIVKELGSVNTSNTLFTSQSFNQQLADSSLNHTASQTLISLLEGFTQDIQTQSIPLIKLARPLINSLNQDDIRIWFNDPANENPILNHSFAGNIFQSECHPLLVSLNCISDTGYLTENNLSVAALNFYSKRQLQHQITIQDQALQHSYILNYTYDSVPKEINRDYQALYQIYLHPNAEFVSVERNNQEIDLKVTKEIVDGLSLFQIPVSHKPEGSVSIKLNFSLKNILPANITQGFAYSIKTFHQPGIDQKNTQIIINHSTKLSVTGVTSSASIGSGKVIYQPVTTSTLNSIFGVQFASQP